MTDTPLARLTRMLCIVKGGSPMPTQSPPRRPVARLRRRALLKAGLAAGATFAAWPLLHPPALWGAKAGPPKRSGSRFDRLRKKPNILILLNDQQRYERDWPL